MHYCTCLAGCTVLGGLRQTFHDHAPRSRLPLLNAPSTSVPVTCSKQQAAAVITSLLDYDYKEPMIGGRYARRVRTCVQLLLRWAISIRRSSHCPLSTKQVRVSSHYLVLVLLTQQSDCLSV